MGQFGYLHGDLGWSQLCTSNPSAALDFYAALVGWEKKEEMEPGYHVFGRGDEYLGGITQLQESETTPYWMPYITVDDLDATLAKVAGLGGSIVVGRTPLPEDSGHIAVIKDSQGALTGLAQYARKE